MTEILYSLGGLLIVQIGLTVRKWISERKHNKSNETIKEELLKIISDLKFETNRFKDEINTLNIQLKQSKEENNILFKHYQKLDENYKELKKQLEQIGIYAKFSKDLKVFENEKTSYALDLINNKNSSKKLNPYLRSFLETGAKSLIKIQYKVLSHGLDKINVQVIESDFNDSELCLRYAFSCKEMEVKKEDVETIIYTEKGKFITQLSKITDKEDGIKDKDLLRSTYMDLCDTQLENIIIEIKNL